MKIHIDSEVLCGEEVCGKVTCVIVDPQSDELTHLVVTETNFPLPSKERLVSIEHVSAADEGQVILDCSHEELLKMKNFIDHEFVPSGRSMRGYGSEHLREPFTIMKQVDHEEVPSGELAIHSGANVYAEGEVIGKVDDFLIRSQTEAEITHIVLREGHLWAKKLITIPVSNIAEIKHDGIYLNLEKKEVEALPSVQVKGWFG